MTKSKSKMPNLANATPAFLLDEFAKAKAKENEGKKEAGLYRTALLARLDSHNDQTIDGEEYVADLTNTAREGFDVEKFIDLMSEEVSQEIIDSARRQCALQTPVLTIRTRKKQK